MSRTCSSHLTHSHRLQRRFAEHALSRTSGAPLCDHNRVRILQDADENHTAWLRAIAGAERFVHLENYIIQEDATGRLFADALIARARAGVTVRVVHDWLGSWRCTSRRFWQRLTAAGVRVRCFNPPRLDSPLGWLARDHRKTVAIDGRIAFAAGVCISSRWRGNPARSLPPWRDTGVQIEGPAVAEIHSAFAQIWRASGGSLPRHELPRPESVAPAGDISLRVIAGTPLTAGLLRTDQLIAVLARRSLWLTDAYFIGPTPYVQALLAAARDGVDVRILIPHASDLPLVGALTRSGLRPLLEGGIRIFAWNGSMLHAKTAVVDGRWSRIGSSNLNLASLLGNYELDIAIDHPGVAQEMERMYLRDLDNATEIVLSHHGLRPSTHCARSRRDRHHPLASSGSAAAVGAIRAANAVGAAMSNRRVLGPAESGLLVSAGLLLLAIAPVAITWPKMVALPVAALAGYLGLALLWRARKLRHRIRLPMPSRPRPAVAPAAARSVAQEPERHPGSSE